MSNVIYGRRGNEKQEYEEIGMVIKKKLYTGKRKYFHGNC